MRLFTKITLLNLILMLIVFTISGFVTLRMVRHFVKKETDYQLIIETRILVRAIKEGKPIEALENSKVSIVEISMDNPENHRGVFSDTIMMHRAYDRMEEFRKLVSTHKIGGKQYSITMTDVFIEQKDMLDGVLKTMINLFLALSAMLFLFSFLFSKWLLHPFDVAIGAIKKFNVRNTESLVLAETKTKEFSDLNHFVVNMTQKAQKDYSSLKEFSENASHELQTPIAVAQGRLELLQDSSSLGENEHKLIETVQNSLNRISRLGQSLSLITKIENLEYSSTSIANLSKVVTALLDYLGELAQLKKLTITKNITNEVFINMDESLAEIMISNLIKNSIQHNHENGFIDILLDKNEFRIRNSGNDPKMKTDKLFERFKKSNQSGASLGLGLSIVKQICDLNGYEVRYDYEANTHELKILFEQGKKSEFLQN